MHEWWQAFERDRRRYRRQLVEVGMDRGISIALVAGQAQHALPGSRRFYQTIGELLGGSHEALTGSEQPVRVVEQTAVWAAVTVDRPAHPLNLSHLPSGGGSCPGAHQFLIGARDYGRLHPLGV